MGMAKKNNMTKKKTYVYALDLALNSTGICIFSNDGKFVETFTIDTHKEKNSQLKLKMIGEYFINLKSEYPPSEIIMEQGFSRFNISTQSLFRVQGIVIYIFSDYKQTFIAPATVKKEITGKGNAKKEQVRKCIAEVYPEIQFDNLDQSDAFAVGLTHFIQQGDLIWQGKLLEK